MRAEIRVSGYVGDVCSVSFVGGWAGRREGMKRDGYDESVVGCGGRVEEEVFGLRRWGRAVAGCDSGVEERGS